jgi:exopolyphosphatase/guanosine-5'-triphosphate,3'-diphosphate pyrophosphatase
MSARRDTPPPPIAVVDIGTNSVKLLVASSDGCGIETIAFRRETTRLGTGLASADNIGNEAARRTAAAVAELAEQARTRGARDIVGVGTYALRSARNGERVARSISRAAGIPVRILTGREEARYAFVSARAGLAHPRRLTFMLDVGGGSAQFVVAENDRVRSARSYPLGALRLTEKYLQADPIDAAEYDRMRREIGSVVERAVVPFLNRAMQAALVAVGGSATTALAMARGGKPEGRSGTLRLGDLRRLEKECLTRSLAERKQLPGLPADRADIIPAGIAVVVGFMAATGKRVVHVSGGGVREGVILEMAAARQ